MGAQDEKTGGWKSGEAEVEEGMVEVHGRNEASHPETGPLVCHARLGERRDVGAKIVACLHAVTMVSATAQDPPHQEKIEVEGRVYSQQVAADRQGGGEKAVICDQKNLGIADMAAPALAALQSDDQENVGMTAPSGVESIAVAVALRLRSTHGDGKGQSTKVVMSYTDKAIK